MSARIKSLLVLLLVVGLPLVVQGQGIVVQDPTNTSRKAGVVPCPNETTGIGCLKVDASGGGSIPVYLAQPPAVTATTGTGGPNGQNWFLSQPPGFNPWVRIDGGTSGSAPSLFFLDDLNMVAFAPGSPNNTVHQWRSNNAGRSWIPVAQSQNFFGGFTLRNALRMPAGNFLFISSEGASSPFWLGDGINLVRQNAVGNFANGGTMNPALNGNTVLAYASSLSSTVNDIICRSPSSGTGWDCETMPPIRGYTGTGGWNFNSTSPVGNIQALAPVTPSVWLTIGKDGTDGFVRILRSTDDGLTWQQQFNAAVAGDFTGVQCFPGGLICLGANGQEIYRSADGGLTWAKAVTNGPGGAATNWGGVVVFDSLTAVIVPALGAATVHFYRTADGGLTWLDVLEASGTCPFNSGGGRGLVSAAVRNGRAAVISSYTTLVGGGPCAAYSTLGTSSSGVTQVGGPSGSQWDIGPEGYGPVSQGNSLVPFTTSASQQFTILNAAPTTSAANTAAVVTLAGAANKRVCLRTLAVFSSAAATTPVTITAADGATTVLNLGSYTTGLAANPTSLFLGQPLMCASTGNNLVINIGAAGVGLTTTTTAIGDRG